MIIKEFQKIVEKYGNRTAVKTLKRSITYHELENNSNRLAQAIIAAGKKHTEKRLQAALFFEHGTDMILAVLGVLKANKTYVPLDINLPKNRLKYMLEHSESTLLLTNNQNFFEAKTLAESVSPHLQVLNIETRGRDFPNKPVQQEIPGQTPAYILYTSGSTGRPKGVVQTHRSVLHYARQWIKYFNVTEQDRMTMLSTFSHDGAVPDIYGALLSGATLYPYDFKSNASSESLLNLFTGEKITIWHSVPSLYRFFCSTLREGTLLDDIRWVVLGGESVRVHDLNFHTTFFPNAVLANLYGQTESTINSICSITVDDTFDNLSLGTEMEATQILLVTEDGDTEEDVGVGEIVIAGDYIAHGYWKDDEKTEEVFTHDEELGRLYWTGDLGQRYPNGSIKMVGRSDAQVKIRGFRVETGEIESILLQHPEVKEAAVISRVNEAEDIFLCAYYTSGTTLKAEDLRNFLAQELPDYMLPRYLVFMESMPLTPSNKIDRNAFPNPAKGSDSDTQHEAPRTETEKIIAAIWEEALEIERIGINDNFIELGGHSLLVISITSRIHHELNVELVIQDVFDNPTVKELSLLVDAAGQVLFESIEKCEEKKHYAASFEQVRMFILNKFEGIGTTYNLTSFNEIEECVDRPRLEKAFQELFERHEVLRTSFQMAEEQVVQKVHMNVPFNLNYIDAQGQTDEEIRKQINQFIRPFDLSSPPLFRACLISRSADNHLLVLDIHHIITDGLSGAILTRDLSRLYTNEELPPLKLSYKDYSEWQYRLLNSPRVLKQEEYWLDTFKGKLPHLNLPFNFPRPAVQSFEGGIIHFQIDESLAAPLYELVKEYKTTLYNILLSSYYVLLYKYTQQEDTIIGSIISSRNHIDLEGIVGFFAKTLAFRNHPTGEKTFLEFQKEVKQSVLSGFENQQYPFSQLVEKLELWKDRRRNPLFDTAFVLQTLQHLPNEETNTKLNIKPAGAITEDNTSMFDLYFEALDIKTSIRCCFQYCAKLFKRETIELMKERFLVLIENIANNPHARIRDLVFNTSAEKEMKATETIEFEF